MLGVSVAGQTARCCFGEVLELASDEMSRAEHAKGVVGFERAPALLSGVGACAGASSWRGSRAGAPVFSSRVLVQGSWLWP